MTDNEITPSSVVKDLKTAFVGQNVLYYPEATSTMDVARDVAISGAAEGTVVLAEIQTGGRGRLGRQWLSPQGSLSLSLILYPQLAQLPFLIMAASLAVVHSIKAVTGVESQIKWPNDVLIKGRKVCGILVESALEGNGVKYAVIGIGLNVNFNAQAFPEISDIATSLSSVTGREVSRREVAQRLLSELEGYYLAVKAGEPIHEEWRSRLETLGKRVQVRWGDTVSEGCAEDVNSQGSLWLRHDDGSLTSIVAGDVTLSHRSPG